jgi:hypothetical protein
MAREHNYWIIANRHEQARSVLHDSEADADAARVGADERLPKNAPHRVIHLAPVTEQQKKAVTAWLGWYSARLDRISDQLEKGAKDHEDYTGYEQDLFEAFHCDPNYYSGH